MSEVIFKPQSGTTLLEAAKEAVKKAKALYKETGYGYLELCYNDLILSVNELTTPICIVDEFCDKLRQKYCVQGGIASVTLQYEDWIEKYIKKPKL